MNTEAVNQEYQTVNLSQLTESLTNPRKTFDHKTLNEMAESIRAQGVLSPLLVRPLAENSFEIVAGARRYRAALLAEAETVPVRIVPLTDAQALEAQLIELSIVVKRFFRFVAVLHVVDMSTTCRFII